jgi:hypothetical protein
VFAATTVIMRSLRRHSSGFSIVRCSQAEIKLASWPFLESHIFGNFDPDVSDNSVFREPPQRRPVVGHDSFDQAVDSPAASRYRVGRRGAQIDFKEPMPRRDFDIN